MQLRSFQVQPIEKKKKEKKKLLSIEVQEKKKLFIGYIA
jgi:hypothetical protein